MSTELESKQSVSKLDSMIEKKGGLFDALEQQDKIILLDFSGSMDRKFEGKELYQHLIDAVRSYEREYVMVRFDDKVRVIECLERERTGGGTNLMGALVMAHEKEAEESIVVSDGLPNVGGYPDECLRYAVANKMKISTIFIGDNLEGSEFMRKLASMTGGKSGNDVKLLAGFGGLLKRTVKGLIEG